jgi:hypothetical protein
MKSRLWDMDALAGHHASPKYKQSNHGVEFQPRTLGQDSKRNVLVDPSIVDPVGHQGSNAQGRRDGGAFKVFGLAGGVLGKGSNGDVETCKASQAAKDEEGEEEVINRRAKADGEGCCGWGNAERNLTLY